MKKLKNKFLQAYRHNFLAISLAALSTGMIATTVAQASDIKIYQTAKSGDITLMLLIDDSGSMGSRTNTSSYMYQVNNALRDLLQGNTNVVKLKDEYYIGLMGFNRLYGATGSNGYVPARRLDEVINGKTHRQILLDIVNNNLNGSGGTPTGPAYARAVSSMLGTQGYTQPNSLSQIDEVKKCSGQGIYVLTDGRPESATNAFGTEQIMRSAIGNNSFTCNAYVPNSSYSGNWNCIHGLANALLEPSSTTLKIKFKTAVVGFGNVFSSVSTYNRGKTQQENIDALLPINNDPKRAALWGIWAEGGWYSGSKSQDVVDSINNFISSLAADIPTMTTGSPTIPRDSLNPVELQLDAYYQQFQPTPDKMYQVWLGNLKKYQIVGDSVLKGRSSANVVDQSGKLIEPTYDSSGNIISAVYDFWSALINLSIENADINTEGSRKFAAKGGVWSKLSLRKDNSGNEQRKLLTNRIHKSGSGTSSIFGTTTTENLRTITSADLTDSQYRNDPDRGYLMALLGYKVDDVANPTTVNPNGLEFRQMGAVMHSAPILVTNKGKVAYNKNTASIESTNREDYILFGSTQGLLHVVDAETGKEKFAFVPNEMIENQKNAFLEPEFTNGGLGKFYYGVDGPWTVHTEYVVDSSGNLTVGTGKGTLYGKQIAYGGLRMGGRSYYALDLKNINDPKLKFHINPAAASANTPLSFMGQSWSKPTVGYINWGGVRKLVMFVGGGYDAGGDDGDARNSSGVKGIYAGYEDPEYNQTNKKGAGVYMFSADGADAGDLLWWSSANVTSSSATSVENGVIATASEDMKYSVVNQIRTVDRDGDELIDHIYFGDLGGQVFRVDFDNKATTLGAIPKKPVRLLNLHKADGKSPRFYDMPGFSLYRESGTTFAVISIGSGDRSSPLQDYTVSTAGYDYDAIYNIYDKDVARKDIYNNTDSSFVYTSNNATISDLGLIDNNNRVDTSIQDANGRWDVDELVAPLGRAGWYYKFNQCTAGVDGTKNTCSNYKLRTEKVFGTPLAMNYKLFVSTFDASKPGLAGDCGAGVKGESFISSFCLPFGQCAEALSSDEYGGRKVIGPGIHNAVPSPDPNPPVSCVGSACTIQKDIEESNAPGRSFVSSGRSYCVSGDSRQAYTIAGGFGGSNPTQICLIPHRWYEKLAIPSS